MSFQILGKAPRGEAGRCFDRNNAGWHQIADVCLRFAPEVRASGGFQIW